MDGQSMYLNGFTLVRLMVRIPIFVKGLLRLTQPRRGRKRRADPARLHRVGEWRTKTIFDNILVSASKIRSTT